MNIFMGFLIMLWKVATDQPQPKADFLAALPAAVSPVVGVILSVSPILMIFPGLFALTTLAGAKRPWPHSKPPRAESRRPGGPVQPVADGLKMLTKEDIVPRTADHFVHFIAPIALLIPTLLAYAVLPYARNLVPLNLDAGLLFFFAVGGFHGIVGVHGGWSSRNKYSLLGAMRAIAQMISYEIPLILSSITVVMITGSLSLVSIVEHQAGYLFGFLPHWNVFTPWGLAGFVMFLIATLAESNRSPFDIPEAESEIIAGHLTEYSGFKYALFFLAEYLGMFAMSGLAATLFLGGWQSPVAVLDWMPSYIWFLGKLMALVCLFIWVRGTVPRLRVDQLLNFAWKFMLPLALLNLVVAAVWHYTSVCESAFDLLWRWVLCGLMIGLPYAWLGRGLSAEKGGPRVYRFAE